MDDCSQYLQIWKALLAERDLNLCCYHDLRTRSLPAEGTYGLSIFKKIAQSTLPIVPINQATAFAQSDFAETPRFD